MDSARIRVCDRLRSVSLKFRQLFLLPVVLAGCAGEAAPPTESVAVAAQPLEKAVIIENGAFEAVRVEDNAERYTDWEGNYVVTGHTQPHRSGDRALSLTAGQSATTELTNLVPERAYRIGAYGYAQPGQQVELCISHWKSETEPSSIEDECITFRGGNDTASCSGSSGGVPATFQYATLGFRIPRGDAPRVTVTVRRPPGSSEVNPAFVDDIDLTRSENPVRDASLAEPGLNAWNRYGDFSCSGAPGAEPETLCLSSQTRNSGAEQTITGLQPNTRYALRATLKVSAQNNVVYLGVKNHGGPETSVYGWREWDRYQLTFTTGPTNTNATIYLYKPLGTGTGWGYGDDFEIVPLGPSDANSVVNPGFESPLGSEWRPYGGWSIATHSGGKAARIAGTGGFEQTISNLSPGRIYRLKARINRSSDDAVYIGVKNYGGLEKGNTPAGALGTWSTTDVVFQTSGSSAVVYFYKPAGAGSAMADDFSVSEVSPNLLSNGDFELGTLASWVPSPANGPSVSSGVSAVNEGLRAALLPAGSTLTNTVDGLTPTTRYMLTADVATSPGGSVALRVYDDESNALLGETTVCGNGRLAYRRVHVDFKTLEAKTRVRVVALASGQQASIDRVLLTATDLRDRDWTGWSSWAAHTSDAGYTDLGYSFGAARDRIAATHRLPDDLTAFAGLRLKFEYLTAPSYAPDHTGGPRVIPVRLFFHYRDGGFFWFMLRPFTDLQQSNSIDILTLAAAEAPRPMTGFDRVEVVLEDDEDPTRVLSGSLRVHEFRLLTTTETEDLAAKNVDLAQIGKMDDPSMWLGPRPEQRRVTPDGLEVTFGLNASERFRLERNLVDRDVSHGGTMARADLSAVHTISFQWKANAALPGARFVLWDRNLHPKRDGGDRITRGFAEWSLAPALAGLSTTPKTVCLNLSSVVNRTQLNKDRIGGFMWEIDGGPSGLPAAANATFGKLTFHSGAAPACDTTISAARTPSTYSYAAPTVTHTVSNDAKPRLLVLPTEIQSFFAQRGKNDAIDCDQPIAPGNPTTHLGQIRSLIADWKTRYGSHWNALFPDRTDVLFNAEEWSGDAGTGRASQAYCVARALKEEGLRFWVQVGTPNGLPLSWNHVAPIFADFGQYAQGLYVAETPLEESCDQQRRVETMLYSLPAGKKLLWHRFSFWYWRVAQGEPLPSCDNRSTLERLFNANTRHIIVPMGEMMEPSTPGVNLSMPLGFQVADRANDWGMSVQAWYQSNMRYLDWAGQTNDQWVRLLMTAAGAGARYLQIEGDWDFSMANIGYGDERTQANLAAFEVFAKLVDSGAVVTPATHAQNIGLASVVIEGQTRTSATLQQSYVSLPEVTMTEMSMQLRDVDVFRRLLNGPHPYEQLMPETPYGLVAYLPPPLTAHGRFAVRTDFLRVLRTTGTWTTTPKEASDEIVNQFVSHTGPADCRLTGGDRVFMGGVRVGAGDRRLYLVDPEERFPRDRTVQFRCSFSATVTEAVNGALIAPSSGTYTVTVPAGGYRILKVAGGS